MVYLKNGEKYYDSDPDGTEILFTDTLNLYNEKINKYLSIQKKIIKVGTSNECDLNFGMDNTKIEPLHASFYFEEGRWYIKDHRSVNGTFLNYLRLDPDVKYRLHMDDVLIFAQDTKLIVEKTSPASTPLFMQQPLPQTFFVPPMPTQVLPKGKKQLPFLRKWLGKKTVMPIPQTPVGNTSILCWLPIGKVIAGEYIIEAQEGKNVYRAGVIGSKDKVAVKVQINNPVSLNAFKNCYEIQKKISHAGVPKVRELIVQSKELYLITDYVEGKSLDKFEKRIWTAREVAAIAYKVAGILRYMHSLTPPIIYRDVKPSNILLGTDRQLYLIDYGIAMEATDEQKEDIWYYGNGSFGYAAPEQYMNKAEIRSDIYCLGVTMYALLRKFETGHEFELANRDYITLPAGIKDIVEKCTRMNVEERYQNCEELMKELNAYLKKTKKKSLRKHIGRK